MDAFTSISGETENTLGARIRRARLLCFWTLEQLADRLGVSKVTVWNWECNRARPRLQRLRELSALFDIPTDALTTDDGSTSADLGELIVQCQEKIAAMAGVQPQHVEISVKFGASESSTLSPAPADQT